MMEHLLTSPKSEFNPSITGWEVLKQTTAVLNMWTFLSLLYKHILKLYSTCILLANKGKVT